MKWLLPFLCLLALVYSGAPSLAQEEAASGRAILVLDASGSMWGQIEGKAKIEIAQEAIKSLVKEMDPGVQLGLTAYGHNRKGDCTDIESLIPAGPGTGRQIVATVNKLKPKGKTPLSDAVRQAAHDLKYTEEAASVILLSDGLETCGADPCALARELEQSGADFVIHVIGFDLTQKERQSLQCLADETGGQFLAAGDAGSLATALLTAVKQMSIGTKPHTAVRPYLVESGVRPNGFFQWTFADETGKTVLEQTEFHIVEDFPSGTYTVTARQLNAKGMAVIEVDQDNPQDHKIEINGGILSVNAIGEDKQPYVNEDYLWWSLYPLDAEGRPTEKHLTREEGINETFLLAPGRYLARAKSGLIGGEVEVEVKPGQVTEASLTLTSGRIVLTAMATKDGQKYDGRDYVWWSVYPIGENGQVAEKHIAKEDGLVKTFDLAPGRYLVKTKAGVLGAQTEVTVTAGETLEQSVLLETGQLVMTGLSTAGGDKFDGVNYLWWSVFPIDDSGKPSNKYLVKQEGVVEIFDLPPGRYLIKAQAGPVRAQVEATVEAGKTNALSLNLNAARVELTALKDNGDKYDGREYVWWSLYPQGAEKHIAKDEGVVQPFDLPAGEYRVKVQVGDATFKRKFSVRAGERKRFSVSVGKAK